MKKSILLFCLCLLPFPGRAVSSALLHAQDDFTAVAERAGQWVVNISSSQIVHEVYSPFGNDPFFNQFFDIPYQGRTLRRQSLGSGLILTADGEILTNAHVVAGADEITVRLLSGEEYKGKVLGSDENVDLAVLKIKPSHPLPPAVLGDSDKVKVGQWAIAIGSPLGFDHSVTVGVISAVGRKNVFGEGSGSHYQDFLQTDAAINHGNSGGPLCNVHGEVIGINTAIATPNEGSIGIGFALPINMAKNRAIPELVKRGRVVPPQLGFYTQDLTPQLAKAMHLSASNGVLVADVAAGGAAAKAGLQRGDVILAIGGRQLSNSAELKSLLYEYKPGDSISVTILRRGATLNLNMVGQDAGSSASEAFWHGLQVVENSRNYANEHGLAVLNGVVVTRVTRNSSGAEAGLAPNDVILEINEQAIRNLDDWQKVSQNLPENQEALLRVLRGREMAYVVLRAE